MKKIITTLMILVSSTLFAQQDPLFSQYMFNKLAINPGYAGSRELLTADLLYRNQWTNIDGAPKTISASIHAPLNNPHIALGIYAYNDVIGPMRHTGTLATFAYRIIFPEGKLSFGIQAGFKYSGVDYTKIHAFNINDPFLLYPIKNRFAPDANFGIYYYSEKFYIGLSSRQLLQNETVITTDTAGNTQFTKLLIHFYGMTGIAVPVGDNIIFRPSMLAKFVKNAPPQLDLNASFLFGDKLWIGASYRTEKAISLMTELIVAKNFRIGYSYDIWLNELKACNEGSHEIRLSYDLHTNNNRMRTPRYF